MRIHQFQLNWMILHYKQFSALFPVFYSRSPESASGLYMVNASISSAVKRRFNSFDLYTIATAIFYISLRLSYSFMNVLLIFAIHTYIYFL